MKIVAGIFICCCVVLDVNAQDTNFVKKKVNDSITVSILNEVVVSASRVSEKILQSPVSIEKVGTAYFKSSPAPSFFDALENVKGVQLITPSIGFKVINARGFANTTNVRFAQLVDGMDIQAPHIGGPIANLLGPNDMDIESVEIIPGAASALYGMNTINGLANFITKDPFTSEGIIIQQKTGVNHLGDSNSVAKIYSETSLRIDHVISKKFSFKINGTFMKGYDWIADDHTDLNAAANTTLGLTGGDNPGMDPVNGYGNESSDRKTLTLGGKSYVIARTGYFEKEVTDYSLQNIKADATLAYKINSNTQLNYTYKYATLDNVYQRSNRFRLDNYVVQQHGLKLKSKTINVQAYWNRENTGDSYNLRSQAENIDNAFKSATVWYSDFTKGFTNAITGGATTAQALKLARAFADSGRYQPGTAIFQNTFDKLKNINNWDSGSALRVHANLVDVDGQIDLTENLLSSFKNKTGIQLLAGFDYRTYIVVPDGNYFINPASINKYSNLVYGETGGFLSVTKELLHKKLKLGGILRADKNDYFATKFNPRFSVVYSPTFKHNFRFSFQTGYRFPSLFEGFSNVNSGGVKRVGGLPVMSHGIFENAYLKTSIDAFQAQVNKDVNTLSISKDSAIRKDKGMLVKNTYTYLVAEHISSFEMGYKGLLLDSRLFVDVDFYYNVYHSFIAQVEMSTPHTQNPDSIAIDLNDKNLQDRYRLWTNSKTTVYNYGGSLGLKYNFNKGYIIGGNLSFAQLDKVSSNDGLEDGFNTPKWMTNITISNEHLCKNFGAGITYKWQSSYYWQSFLVNGQTPAYGTVDAQVTYIFQKPDLGIKLGATNLLNHYYNSFLGGPSIGGLYYLTLTYGIKRGE